MNVSDALNELFGNKKFMQSIIIESNYNIELIKDALANVIKYYITTRDESIDYEYKEIKAKYSNKIIPIFKDDNSQEMTKEGKNAIQNGFLTHSFNGYKKERIQKYGLNYMEQVTSEERKEILEARQLLEKLEDYIGKSIYVKNEEEKASDSSIHDKIVYLTSPGGKTILYGQNYSPERLYEGPLKQFLGFEEEIIVGETKEDYMFRLAKRKIETLVSAKEQKKALEVAKKVINYYCSKNPCFALIDMTNIQDVHMCDLIYDENEAITLKEMIKKQGFRTVDDFYTKDIRHNGVENCNLANLVVLSKDIPKEAVSIVEMMDVFEIKQQVARALGAKIGQTIDYNDCYVKGVSNIENLLSVIKNAKNPWELSEIKKQYKNIRDYYYATSKEGDSDEENISFEGKRYQKERSSNWKYRKDVFGY